MLSKPILEVLGHSQFVDVGLQISLCLINHVRAQVSGEVACLHGFQTKCCGKESAGSASNLKNMFGLIESEHMNEADIKALHAGVKRTVDRSDFIPLRSNLINCQNYRLHLFVFFTLHDLNLRQLLLWNYSRWIIILKVD